MLFFYLVHIPSEFVWRGVRINKPREQHTRSNDMAGSGADLAEQQEEEKGWFKFH